MLFGIPDQEAKVMEWFLLAGILALLVISFVIWQALKTKGNVATTMKTPWFVFNLVATERRDCNDDEGDS